MVAVAKTADLVLMLLDATKGPVQRKLLERELEAVGIRLNTQVFIAYDETLLLNIRRNRTFTSKSRLEVASRSMLPVS